jgi:dienelactone hydrolase
MIPNLIALCALLAAPAPQQAPSQAITIREGWVVSGVARGGRVVAPVDAVVHSLAIGKYPEPPGALPLPDESSAEWRQVKANEEGAFDGASFRGGYFHASVSSLRPRPMILEASGHGMVYVNGAPRAGDPYGYGYLRLPVTLRQGDNSFLFAAGRGAFRARLVPPRADAQLDTGDLTVPDVLIGPSERLMGAIVVINSTEQPMTDLRILTEAPGVAPFEVNVPRIGPMTIRKVPFGIELPAQTEAGEVTLNLTLSRRGQAAALDAAPVRVRVRRPNQVHKRTFFSRIDGSVQYYAVNPAQRPARNNALVLSLHGASVEALGQAEAYQSKDWATIVAPTNRRPFGFDWEEWGRIDALEVLEHAQRTIPHDPRRVILTGHSMGGHGTWHLGLTYPTRWAAIGPAAGWSSFFNYGGMPRLDVKDPVQAMLARASSPSDTLLLARNSLAHDVYILHGDKDDNVPVTEARLMRETLRFHPRLQYHEVPGAGHWWGGDSVDWRPMFDLFERVRLPERRDQVDFTTMNPGISAQAGPVTVLQQQRPGLPSRVVFDRRGREASLETTNVRALQVADLFEGGRNHFVIDGQRMSLRDAWVSYFDMEPLGAIELSRVASKIPGLRRMSLVRDAEGWFFSNLGAGHKTPERTGPFKAAFDNEMIFVYGTNGTTLQNAWAYDKARFDAETFYYRGNGSMDVLPDTDLNPALTRERNVILYGNAQSHRLWNVLMPNSPVVAITGGVRAGDRIIEGEDMVVLVVRPKPGSDRAMVAAIAPSGYAGERLAERLPYFVSGVAYPDWTVLGAEAVSRGVAGVRGAGYFGNRWAFSEEDSAWRAE